MSSRVRNPRGRSSNGPPGFIRPCRPILAHHLPDGPGWVHELKHDGYRLQIHVRDGRARLYTMNGANWSDRYLRIIEATAKIKGHAVLDAEAVCLDVAGTEGDPETKVRLAAFRQGLEKRGWFEGRNVRIEIIFAGGNVNQYGQFAKELVATQPDVILAQTT